MLCESENSYKGQTGEQGFGISSLDVVMSFWTFNGGDIDGDAIDWTGLTEVSVPTPPATNATNWTKAIDFSGGNEHLKQVSSSTTANAIRMGGLSTITSAPSTSGYTSNHGSARPWATAIVFQTPNNTTNQHIWNLGEGASTGDDNIYLRIVGSSGELYFGWGRDGSGYNEYKIGNYGGSYNQSTGQWWGIYIAHDGTRLSGSNATAANLVDAFDIKVMGSNDTTAFGGIYTVGNDVADWTSTGARMDRAIDGDFTLGGRGSNRSFHGKIASMVVTTLDRNVAMPTDAEAEMMITDPVGWLNDYKVGNTYRQPHSYFTYNFALNNNGSAYATQVWLMGDGSNDSYANGIRNYVANYDQNITKLQLNNMVSSDIQNVSIAGLT